jgi:hypothetical protein
VKSSYTVAVAGIFVGLSTIDPESLSVSQLFDRLLDEFKERSDPIVGELTLSLSVRIFFWNLCGLSHLVTQNRDIWRKMAISLAIGSMSVIAIFRQLRRLP